MNKFCKILLAAAAVTALAAPALAADKLIVKDAAGTADVFKVTDIGEIVMPSSVGTGRGASIKNPAALDNFAMMAAYPSTTNPNAGFAYQVIPKGTGFSATLKAQLSLFNTDYVADPLNYEFLSIRAAGASLVIGAAKVGTGVLRPIRFEMGNNQPKLTIDTTGYVGIGTTTPSSVLSVVGLPTYADNAAATTGGLAVGAFYKTATGVVMVRY